MKTYLICAAILYVVAYASYLALSHGLGNKAKYLQSRRFIPCALAAVIPAALAQMPLTSPLFVIPAVIALLWIFTFPSLFYISNHKVSSDFEFHFEAVSGSYFIAWISGGGILLAQQNLLSDTFVSVILTVIEVPLLLLPLAQLVYFALYKACINDDGMQMILATSYNEVIEYFKSLPAACRVGCALAAALAAAACGYANWHEHYHALAQARPLSPAALGIIAALFVFLTVYLWKKRHGVFRRTAIIELYLDCREYMVLNKKYAQNMKERIQDLRVEKLSEPFDKPSTFILVIGESASRDYMQAFNPAYVYPTTPWLNGMKQSNNFLVFPNAYSCGANTIIAVSHALTETNQYNDKKFYESCSIVDVARKLGCKIHWYSNQGYLGCADTQVTLLANTADVAKWTRQELNKVQYDASLLSYLEEVDPQKNNFVVLHLKGSHFNFENRYPREFTKFGTPGKYELETNYANSIAYTDYVLQEIYSYAREHLNLQAMVYFSDHGTLPGSRRSPNFAGMGTVRIPLCIYFSDEYMRKNQTICAALRKHIDYYWTNDLAYELLCSVFNIKSNKFEEANSLASEKFRYRREDLLTHNGRVKII